MLKPEGDTVRTCHVRSRDSGFIRSGQVAKHYSSFFYCLFPFFSCLSHFLPMTVMISFPSIDFFSSTRVNHPCRALRDVPLHYAVSRLKPVPQLRSAICRRVRELKYIHVPMAARASRMHTLCIGEASRRKS